MANVYVLNHPLIQHKLAILRNKDTSVKEFRELINEISGLILPPEHRIHQRAVGVALLAEKK